MHIQAITMADITNSSDKNIITDQLEGRKHQGRRSDKEWPTVGPMKKKFRKEWKNCVRETFCHRGTNIFKNLLGRWIRTDSQQWNTYMFRGTRTLLWRRVENGEEKWYDH